MSYIILGVFYNEFSLEYYRSLQSLCEFRWIDMFEKALIWLFYFQKVHIIL